MVAHSMRTKEYNSLERRRLKEYGKTYFKGIRATITIEAADSYAKGTAWTRVIWDVVAVAWLLNDHDAFMLSRIVPTKIPTDDGLYSIDDHGAPMAYIYHIKRDALMNDLIQKITK